MDTHKTDHRWHRTVSGVVLSLLCSTACSAANPVYDLVAKPQTVTVKILAISTSIHQAFAGRQEVYLANISNRHEEGDEIVRLVDTYSLGNPIRRVLLADRRSFRMKVTRDPGCDVTGNLVYLGTNSDIFDSNVSDAMAARSNETIPCYKVDHVATRLIK